MQLLGMWSSFSYLNVPYPPKNIIPTPPFSAVDMPQIGEGAYFKNVRHASNISHLQQMTLLSYHLFSTYIILAQPYRTQSTLVLSSSIAARRGATFMRSTPQYSPEIFHAFAMMFGRKSWHEENSFRLRKTERPCGSPGINVCWQCIILHGRGRGLQTRTWGSKRKRGLYLGEYTCRVL